MTNSSHQDVDRTRTPVGTNHQGELVVFLHGLGRSHWCWWWLRRQLKRAGYQTAGWTYLSFLRSIQQLGRECAERLAAFDGDPTIDSIHVITHSLGGIILRQALTLSVPAKLGRIVMLAPPNHGSVWARRLGPVLGPLVPALPQLSDAPDSFVNQLPPMPPGIQVTIVVGKRDGKCPPPTTHLPGRSPGSHGETAHIVISGGHMCIMYRHAAREAIHEFLSPSTDELLKC